MKKHRLYTEIAIFSAFFLLCILPIIVSQFFISTADVFTSWSFPLTGFFNFIIALGLLFYFAEKAVYKPFLLRMILPATFCCCILFCSALVFKFLGTILPAGQDEDLGVSLPETFFEWLFCVIQFLFAAFSEEVFFRFYLPETVIAWVKDKTTKRKYFILIEIMAMIVFASGHFYLGIYSVLNACVAQFVLRFFYKKTKSIIPGFIAHFVYNIIFLILL